MGKKKEEKPGSLSIEDLRGIINAKNGDKIAYLLNNAGDAGNPNDVPYFISTGSRVLDSILHVGKRFGISRITEISSTSGLGKSYLAVQVCKNAQKQDIIPVYYDAEYAINTDFLEAIGMDLDKFIYVQPVSLEAIFDSMEELMAQATKEQRFLFVIDSLAAAPTVSDLTTEFNPQASMGYKARLVSKAMQKLLGPLSKTQSTLLYLNQLKVNLSCENPKYATITEKFSTSGGSALPYACSTRIWLTGSKAKDSYVYDERGYKVGSLVKAHVIKSRHGTTGRVAEFKIKWAGDVRVCDQESWFEAVKESEYIRQSGAWYTLIMEDLTEKKFQANNWIKELEDDAFRQRIEWILDDELITKFANRSKDASKFYGSVTDEIPSEE